jgi:hypothetical protein
MRRKDEALSDKRWRRGKEDVDERVWAESNTSVTERESD